MNKKFILIIIITALLLAGCGRITATNPTQQDGQSTSLTTTTNSSGLKPAAISPEPDKPVATITTSDSIDYNQYLKKAWILNDSHYDILIGLPSFSISKIENGEITGNFVLQEAIAGLIDDRGHLTGIVNKDTAECRFDDGNGCKGNIKLIFKTNDVIEATINYTDTLKEEKDLLKNGTYQFRPYKLKDYDGFSLIESQSFMVDLNSWGNVKFVSGKIKSDKVTSVEFYLVDKDGNMLYYFDTGNTLPVDIKAVSLQDVNKDGLKDIIILVTKRFSSEQAAIVYIQKTDGSFTYDSKLNQEINDSGSNKDIKAVTDYLSKKF